MIFWDQYNIVWPHIEIFVNIAKKLDDSFPKVTLFTNPPSQISLLNEK
jgi:hypothetical protein